MARRRDIQDLQQYADTLEATMLERNQEVRRLTADLAVEAYKSQGLKLRLTQLEQALLEKTGGRPASGTSCLDCSLL